MCQVSAQHLKVNESVSENAIGALHFINGLHLRDGGPSRSVVRLTDSLAQDESIDITLISHSIAGLPSFPSACPLVKRKTATSSNHLALWLGMVDRPMLLVTNCAASASIASGSFRPARPR